jgi:hypothetical protein
MKRLVLLLPLLSVLTWAAFTRAAPFPPEVKGVQVNIEPYGRLEYWKKFEGGIPARVIAVGDGQSWLTLYVYDAHGNCVAWDDDVNQQTADDLAAEWLPARGGTYAMRVNSLGRVGNSFLVRMGQEKAPVPAEPLGTVSPSGSIGRGYKILGANGTLVDQIAFKGGKRACVIVMGDHIPIVPVAIEVYDEQKKLVAVDDHANAAPAVYPKKDSASAVAAAQGNDLAAVIWYPPRDGTYTIRITSRGPEENKCWIAVK